jgi:enoyl-CoA hydratase
MADYANLSRFVRSYMSLWRSPKPVVAQVHGVCVGGGSDLALCSDLIVCADDCRIGYPPARLWGSPTTAMWFYRLGLERAKRLLLTGDAMDGRTAAEWGFACGSYPADRLDEAAMALCRRIALIPANQLRMMKLLVNNAVEQLGLASTQLVGTLLDGVARHTPEGMAFSSAAAENLGAAVAARDLPFGDYGSGGRTVADSLLDWDLPPTDGLTTARR